MRGILIAVLAMAAVAGCESSSGGSGTTPTRTPPGSRTSVHGGGFGRTDVVETPTRAPVPTPTGRPITFVGSNTGDTFRATVWAADEITNCAAHAFGPKMIAFLEANPCRGAHRVLATIVLQGRAVAVSIISTSFASPDPKAPFAVAAKFKRLELAECDCGMTDLLQEGHAVPGFAGTRIPPREAFSVLGQDTGVTILDAWYVEGSTKDQDTTLVLLEREVFLSALERA